MSKTFVVFWLLLLVIVGIYIRINDSSHYSYSGDEAIHLGMAKASSIYEALKFSLNETHPPLGNIIRYYWLKISDEIWFSRSLSLIFGVAFIPLYYFIGKEYKDKLTGLLSATLITFSYGCILQSYIVRNYTILVFFLSFSLYFYLIWRKNNKNYALAGYLIAGILASLTHF
ncbi:MAG: glycosyltransferase family 39 protein, partial [Pseudomonadota bacterium]